jgi:hypothetical protein
MSYANVGRTWTPRSFRDYLGTLARPSWAKSVTLHHTAAPSLAQRPQGLSAQHMINIRDYYAKTLGWSRGPHLFTDENEILGMTPLTLKGTHAVSFNSTSIGIEALGNYDVEDPHSGRGLAVWQITAQATLALLDWLGLDPTTKTVLFHRDDPRTSKTCPGKKVTKDWILEKIRLYSSSPAPLPVLDTFGNTAELVPVVAYAIKKSGKPYEQVARQIVRVGPMVTLAGSWLEGARYDAIKQTTLAPASEIDEALAAWK